MTTKEIKEGVVIGDSGGDPVNMASGELSGNIVTNGGANKKPKKTKVSKKKTKEIVENFLRKE